MSQGELRDPAAFTPQPAFPATNQAGKAESMTIPSGSVPVDELPRELGRAITSVGYYSLTESLT